MFLELGGYLQWSEHNLDTATVEATKPGTDTGHLQYLIDHAKEATHRPTWPAQLGRWFQKSGFEHVSQTPYHMAPALIEPFTQLQCQVAEEYSLIAMDNSEPSSAGPAHRRRIQEATKEIKLGAGIRFIPEVTIGMKPS